MKEELLRLGFTNNEVKVYVVLCKYAMLNGNELSKKAGLDRSVTYNLLSSLSKKGIVGSVTKKNKKQFFITEPENLLKEIATKEAIAKNVIEKVKNMKKSNSHEEIVEVIEGEIGSRGFYSLVSKQENDTLYTYGGSGKMFDKLKIYVDYFSKIFKKNNVGLKGILPYKYENFDNMLILPNSRLLASKILEKQHASFNVFGDYTIFHIYEDEPKLIKIKSKAVAKLMKGIFEGYWDSFPKKDIIEKKG